MQIKTFKPESHKVKALIFGSSGTGKTTFAGTAPKPIFASAENGLLSIAEKQVDYVEIKTIKDLKDLHLYLKNEKHDYETVVIDSITEINDIIKDSITGGKRQMLLQDWGKLAQEIKQIFKNFRDLNMHVIFIAQEKIEKDEEKVIKIDPSLNGKAATEICYFMDIVGHIRILKDGSRVIITEPTATLPTKDRSRKVGNDTETDFSVWTAKVATIETGVNQVKANYEAPSDQPKKPEQPKKAAPAQPKEPAITHKTTKELFAVWNEYCKVASVEKTQQEAIRKATIKRLYNKVSTTQLTEKEAKEFVKKLKTKTAELKKTIGEKAEKKTTKKPTKQLLDKIRNLKFDRNLTNLEFKEYVAKYQTEDVKNLSEEEALELADTLSNLPEPETVTV